MAKRRLGLEELHVKARAEANMAVKAHQAGGTWAHPRRTQKRAGEGRRAGGVGNVGGLAELETAAKLQARALQELELVLVLAASTVEDSNCAFDHPYDL